MAALPISSDSHITEPPDCHSAHIDPRFRDRVVLVTGVNRVGQIGHAVALAFGQAGARLVICDVNTVGVATRAKEFQAAGLAAIGLRRVERERYVHDMA